MSLLIGEEARRISTEPVAELLRPHEAARILKVEPATVYRFIRRGILPAVKIGRTVRIDKDVLLRLVKGFPLPMLDVTNRAK